VAQNPALSRARMALADGIGQIVANGLSIMGVEPAEEML
jgi:arginyl-tRNA synthetase